MFPGGWELIIIVGVLLLLFGAKKLPDMARSIGQSARVFKGEMKGMKADDEASKDAAAAQNTTATQTVTPPAALPPAPSAVTPQPEVRTDAQSAPQAQPGQRSTGQ